SSVVLSINRRCAPRDRVINRSAVQGRCFYAVLAHACQPSYDVTDIDVPESVLFASTSRIAPPGGMVSFDAVDRSRYLRADTPSSKNDPARVSITSCLPSPTSIPPSLTNSRTLPVEGSRRVMSSAGPSITITGLASPVSSLGMPTPHGLRLGV